MRLLDATDHLDDDLCMAYRVPDLLLAGYSPADEIVALARVCDANGLCFLLDKDFPACSLTKVFNNLKDGQQDRQIGDRRGRNCREGKALGPSRWLPAGSDLLDLHLDVGFETFRICCTDRKDFCIYHQFWVSESKVKSNAVGPSVPLSSLQGLRCYDAFLEKRVGAKSKKQPRDIVGDQLREGFGH